MVNVKFTELPVRLFSSEGLVYTLQLRLITIAFIGGIMIQLDGFCDYFVSVARSRSNRILETLLARGDVWIRF